eukprot:6832304-Lingulodinium_polyedra.AAC.1
MRQLRRHLANSRAPWNSGNSAETRPQTGKHSESQSQRVENATDYTNLQRKKCTGRLRTHG